MAGGPQGDQGDDPLEVVQLDEAFVRAAPVVELSAAERVELLGLVPLHPSAPGVSEWREETGRDGGHGAWLRRRNRRLRWVALLAVGSLLGSAIWTLMVIAVRDVSTTPAWSDLHRFVPVPQGTAPTDWTPPSPRPSESAANADDAPGFRYQRVSSDGVTPVGFDPCAEIHWTFNGAGLRAGTAELVAEVFDELSRISGLHFVRDPLTTETPSLDASSRAALQPDRYGDHWAPVLIAAAPIAERRLPGDLLVDTTSSVVESTEGGVLVSGAIVLDGVQFASLRDEARRQVIRHAVGHLVGLDDVHADGQVMNVAASGVDGFAAGDRSGLKGLGRGGCVPR